MSKLGSLGWSVAFLYYIHTHHYTIATISGNSMSPTLNPSSSLTKDYVLLSLSPHTLLKRNIVFLTHPNDPSKLLCKRIVGVAGDPIIKRLKTRYPVVDFGDRVVGEGKMWVEGDEPYISIDSNQFGCVSMSLVKGRVDAIVYPFNRMRFL